MKRAEPRPLGPAYELRWLELIVSAIVLIGCARANTPNAGSSESHFLRACHEACGDGLQCLCGVCSAPCEDDRQCRALPGPSSCEAPAATAGACEGSGEIRSCDATCESDGDCGAFGGEAACVSGRCRYAEDDAIGSDARDGGNSSQLPSGCSEDATDLPPQELACTGLYADIATKQLAAEVDPFAPALAMWSGGADRQRFVYLPPDTRIDASEPDDWRFPAGTKLFQEFERSRPARRDAHVLEGRRRSLGSGPPTGGPKTRCAPRASTAAR